jgi:hypothetical protein
MNKIKLVNFNISTILDYGYCSHLYTVDKLINIRTENDWFLKFINDSGFFIKYTPNIKSLNNIIKLDITDNKLKFINKHLLKIPAESPRVRDSFLKTFSCSPRVSDSFLKTPFEVSSASLFLKNTYNTTETTINNNHCLYIYENYKYLYKKNFYLFVNVIPNFIKVYNYLINKNVLISYTFYDNDLCYDKYIFDYYMYYLTNKNILPHLYHNSNNINESITYYIKQLKIHDTEILNIDNNFFYLLQNQYNIKNVAVINNSSYIGLPFINYKLLELNNNHIQLFNNSKNILKNSYSDYLINDIINLLDIFE